MTPMFEDEIIEPDPLREAIELLLPLRERKLSRLKRKLAEEKETLKQLQASLKKGEGMLILFRQKYQQCLDDFTHHHTGVVLLHEKLHQTLEKEQVTRGRLLQQDEANQQLIDQITQQTQRIEEAEQAVKNGQREIEKLEYILEEKEML